MGAKRREPPVDPGRDALVADVGVHRVREVDGRRAPWQRPNLSSRREHVGLLRKEVHLDPFEELQRVAGLGLHLQKVAHPFPHPELRGVRAGLPDLVHPVRRDSGLRDLVHFLGTDLDLDGRTERSEQRRVQGLVAVGLGDRDVVLEPLGHGFVQTVHQAENTVAVVGPLDDDAEPVYVEHLLEREMLVKHLSIQAVEVLLPALQASLDAFLSEPALHRGFDLVHDPLSVAAHLAYLSLENPMAPGVERAEPQILELDANAAQP